IVVDEQGAWIDVIPMPLQKYARFKLKAYSTVNEALDEYYTRTAAEEKATEASKEFKKELAKQERILQRQEKALEDSVETIEQNRKIGDIIYNHFDDLRIRLQEISSGKEDGKSWKQIASSIKEKEISRPFSSIRFHSLQPEPLTLNVTVDGLTFPLSIRSSIQDNASNYYEKAKRAKKKLDGIRKAIGESQTRIVESQRQRVRLVKESRCKLPPMRLKKAWYEKFRWFHSSDGFLVLGGRDATTNEVLVKKHMEPHDVVFHADVVGAPFVLIKTEGKHPPEQTINESAQLAASYSRAWREMFDTLNVYWVSPKQVSKAALPLKRGAFIIRGSKNYIRNVPLQIAIGIQMKKGCPLVVGGPIEAISKQTSIYVEIIPGNQKSGGIAKHIRGL
ncbi:NFACT family protein, partial [Candidatus Bathyarchaeota archaeon]|nr:NFACT family protein [Candidatus Bathyarchaeota archaeon]